jgi:TRAP-type C4-dicarboxylate transport system permease small subunit
VGNNDRVGGNKIKTHLFIKGISDFMPPPKDNPIALIISAIVGAFILLLCVWLALTFFFSAHPNLFGSNIANNSIVNTTPAQPYNGWSIIYVLIAFSILILFIIFMWWLHDNEYI